MNDSGILSRQVAEWEAEVLRLAELLAVATEGCVVYRREAANFHSDTLARGFRGSVDLSEVEVASFRAATTGPLSQLQVSWLRNGSNGTTLPE